MRSSADNMAEWAYHIRERLEEEDYESEAERKRLEKEYRDIMGRLAERAK